MIYLPVSASQITSTFGISTIELGYLLSVILWSYLIFVLPWSIYVERMFGHMKDWRRLATR